MTLSPTALVFLALLLAVWTAAAAGLLIAAGTRNRQAEASRHAARRLARMIDEAPAIPLLVRSDGRIEGSDRLAHWLGLPELPEFLSELHKDEETGLSRDQLEELTGHVRRAQKTAAPFRMELSVPGSQRSLALRGNLADAQISPGGAAMVWVFDFSESETELARMREETSRAKGDFAALVNLIEAAPMPMWFRGTDTRLRLVNAAYVDAVDGESAEDVIARQVELVESVDGLTAAQIAGQSAQQSRPIERMVQATIKGTRRALKVSDLPVQGEGVAGYAVDIEEMEQQAREHRAYSQAQRSMLDRLSVGVAQFDGKRKLTFANQPFRRIFAIRPGSGAQGMAFDRWLSEARDEGRTPEVRDFPAWRAEHSDWFGGDATKEENWPLADGTHLQIIAQPMPDGGLMLIAEDRTEQLALSATRDTMLRTRTATFDSLFEALAVFAPDGKLQVWNRTFASTWGVEEDLLDTHPAADKLVAAIAPSLARPRRASSIGETIRSATLDRKEKAGRLTMADGRTLEFAGVPLPDGNGLLTALDVTANEQAETALRERNQALEAADQVKTRFLANMSYEFRTPLTSIGGFAELLDGGVAGELTPQGREYTQAIIDFVARLTEQVENVLDLSQGEAGLLPISKQKLELQPFVTGIVREREQAILDKGLSLDLRGAQAAKLEADPRQLGRAIGQLLDNAITATPKGGKLLVDLSRKKDGVRIVISDNGRGMTAEELSRAMDGLRPAKSGDGLERRQGLGIPLARQLVELHGGSLEIQSRRGVGTTALIHLP
ncbi:ATP-binding protein [Qipengyuania sp. DSG2-2]|uniref:sensor histidine kinase n=1 Tax=Qipengyuania sp. DGS2-2 TaxID=3349631 RepID=UPI0036D2F2F8